MYEAGVDEAGRGALVGSVIAAAVILNPLDPIAGLADSKTLSSKKRLLLSDQIKARANAWAIGEATHTEIDELNILQATMVAMNRAIEGLGIKPESIVIDGNRIPELKDKVPCLAIVKGDAKIPSISAASILAKVYRDGQMLALHQLHPQYRFDSNKGYPTKHHKNIIQEYGIIEQHRKTYRPIKMVKDFTGSIPTTGLQVML